MLNLTLNVGGRPDLMVVFSEETAMFIIVSSDEKRLNIVTMDEKPYSLILFSLREIGPPP